MVAADHPEGLVLVSGPSRGGKSRWAEHLVSFCSEVTYIATSPSLPEDASWQERLRLHRERRPPNWGLLECDGNLTSALKEAPDNHGVLIDALGGFTAAWLQSDVQQWNAVQSELLTILKQRHQPVVIVIEETGWGLVPPTAIGGLFRDRQGELAQRLARQANRSWLVVQGRALDLHDLGQTVPL